MRINASTTGNAGHWAERPLVTEGLMREVGDLQLSNIRRRTQSGQGLDGAFTPLSSGYAKKKQTELGSSAANLMVSGRMLNEMVILSTSRNRVTLGFVGGTSLRSRRSQQAKKFRRLRADSMGAPATLIQASRAVPGGDKATFHQVLGAGKSHVKRRFFGLTPTEKATIKARVQAYLRGRR